MAPHQLTEAKVDKQTNNNNTSASNKQTNQGSAHAGGGAELCSDRVQCTMRQSMQKGSGDVSEVRGRALEMCRRYIRKAQRLIAQVIL